MKNALWENIFRHWQSPESLTVFVLKQTAIFQELTAKELRELEHWLHQRLYKPGEIIFKHHAPGEGVYIILSGAVEVSIIDTSGKKNILAQLQQGDFFGEFSLLDGGERSATAIATDHTTLLGFFRPDLFALMDRNPRLGNKLLLALAKVVVARLRKTTELLIQQQSLS